MKYAGAHYVCFSSCCSYTAQLVSIVLITLFTEMPFLFKGYFVVSTLVSALSCLAQALAGDIVFCS